MPCSGASPAGSNRVAGLVVAGLLASALAGCPRQEAVVPNGHTVAIGVVTTPLAGGPIGEEPEVQAMEWYFRQHPLTSSGTKVELVVLDDGGTVAGLQKALRLLDARPDLAVAVSFAPSDRLLRIAETADETGLPILAAVATNPNVARSSELISLLSFDDRFQGQVAALYARNELDLRRAAVLALPRSRYAQFLAAKFREELENEGGQVVHWSDVASDGPALARAVAEARAADAELLYLALDQELSLAATETVAAMDWAPVIMVTDGVLAAWIRRFPDRLESAEGVMATDLYAPGMYLPPAGEAMLKSYGRRGRPVDIHAVLGLEAAEFLRYVMGQCGDTPGRSCAQRTIRGTRDFVGALGKIGFSPEGLAERPIAINRLRDGKREFVVRVY